MEQGHTPVDVSSMSACLSACTKTNVLPSSYYNADLMNKQSISVGLTLCLQDSKCEENPRNTVMHITAL